MKLKIGQPVLVTDTGETGTLTADKPYFASTPDDVVRVEAKDKIEHWYDRSVVKPV